MRTDVSILLPVHNGAATIERAIASIRAQSLREWELIVVDDASDDATPEIVRRIAQDEPRIRVVRTLRGGIANALNAGLTEARASLVARMDADDEADPERLAAQVTFLAAAENQAIGLVSCRVAFGGDGKTSQGYALHVAWINSLLTPEDIALNRFVEAPLAHPSVMFRRELVARHGGYRCGDFPEDYELWLRWMDAGVRMAKLPRELLRWNDAPARLSRTDARYHPDAFFRVKAAWIAKEVQRLANGRSIWIWGAGRHTRKRAAHLEKHGVRIAGYVDVDGKKATAAIGGTGRPVVLYENLAAPEEVFVLGYVTSRGAREFTRVQLTARGHEEGRDFLMCA